MAGAEQFNEVARVAPLVDEWLSGTRAPREPLALLKLLEQIDFAPQSVGVDIGAYSGVWSSAITQATGCGMVALELAFDPLLNAPRGVTPVNGDVCFLPLRDGCLDLVWCRDTLSMVVDIWRAISEMTRVLRDSGSMVIYVALPTSRLEPVERDTLVRDLSLPAWWSAGGDALRVTLRTSPLSVVHEERFSPEFQERQLQDRSDDLLHDLIVRARYERERPALENKVSEVWARRFRAWADWPLYLLLGKLETVAWIVRKGT